MKSETLGAAIIRAEKMRKAGKPVWLIERGQPEHQVPTIWWRGLKDGRGDLGILEGWTTDANCAKPFPTKAIAEEFIGDREHPTRQWRERAVEHLFVKTRSTFPSDNLIRAQHRAAQAEGNA